MFDIGFWELIFIFGLGLLVLGPEKLPRVARTAGKWMARARRVARRFQSEIEREISVEDARKAFESRSDAKGATATAADAKAPDAHAPDLEESDPQATQSQTPGSPESHHARTSTGSTDESTDSMTAEPKPAQGLGGSVASAPPGSVRGDP